MLHRQIGGTKKKMKTERHGPFLLKHDVVNAGGRKVTKWYIDYKGHTIAYGQESTKEDTISEMRKAFMALLGGANVES